MNFKKIIKKISEKNLFVAALLDSVHYLKEIELIISGMIINRITGSTPKKSHLALVAQFTRSGGRLNDRISKVISIFSPPYRIEESQVLVRLRSDERLEEIQERLLWMGTMCLRRGFLRPFVILFQRE